jgi:hypothetical protein
MGSLPGLFGAGVLTWLLAPSGPVLAQAPPPVRLLLSFQPDDKAPEKSPSPNVLRPNVLQEVFAYVKNEPTEEAREVTVQLLAGGSVVATSPKVKVEKGGLARVKWPKPPAAAGAKAPGLTELKGKVAFRLLDAEGKVIGKDIVMEVDRPSNYVEATPTFYPGKGGTNRLIVVVKPKKGEFKGPRCRVELVLRPDRIPGLLPGQKKTGVYAGSLTADSEELVLVAEDLRFSPGPRENGLVYLTVDGCERAFTFETTFSASGTEESPVPLQETSLRLSAAPFAMATVPFPVGVELDNLELAPALRDKVRIKLELLSPVPEVGKKAARESYSELATFQGERNRRLFFALEGPEGGLLFKPDLKDWSTTVDLSAIHGEATLRLRVLDGKTPVPVLDIANDLDKSKDERKKVEAVSRKVALEDSPPEGLRLVRVPKKVVRGKVLRVKARGDDPGERITGVVFFLGKPLPDGKVPPDAVSAPGERSKVADNLWRAELPVPGDQKSPLQVNVRFTNRVGLSKTVTASVEVVDPPKPPPELPKPKRKASIAGTVLEGDRPQNDLTVRLSDAGGKEIKTTKTADGGKFRFTGLEPSKYRVSAAKSASSTRGEATVDVKEQEQKKDVEIKLYR